MTAKLLKYQPALPKLICLLVILLASCNKENNSTVVNNIGTGKPTYAVNGISDLTMVNNTPYRTSISQQLTVQYLDSAQEPVTLSLSPFPSGVTFDSSSWTSSGIPTFSTRMVLSNATDTGALPGAYPMSITGTTASGKVKSYPFTLFIKNYGTAFLGYYDSCVNGCPGGSRYADNVSADPVVRNKIWFSNFLNSGVAVYGLLKANGALSFPSQAIGNDVLNSGSSTINFEKHSMSIFIKLNGTSCSIELR